MEPVNDSKLVFGNLPNGVLNIEDSGVNVFDAPLASMPSFPISSEHYFNHGEAEEIMRLCRRLKDFFDRGVFNGVIIGNNFSIEIKEPIDKFYVFGNGNTINSFTEKRTPLNHSAVIGYSNTLLSYEPKKE